jgi:hypothetical protein
LHDTDDGVADEHDAEDCILQLPNSQDYHEQGAENEIEPGKEIRSQNLGKRSARVFAANVCLTPSDTRRDILGAEARGRGLLSGERDFLD